jgi:branched-chain amino acid aminotransferase
MGGRLRSFETMLPVYVNGKLVNEDAAVVSAFDHGLVVGDGVFETVLVVGRRPFALRRHLDRLSASASGLGIDMPARRDIEHGVALVVEEAGLERARLRITVTSGTGPLGSARRKCAPSLIVAIAPEPEPPRAVAVIRSPWTRNEHGALTGLKTTSYAENARALALAEAAGASEAIFANTAGLLCEGTGSNIFVVIDGRLLTPSLASGCLAGVTRALVLESFGGEETDIPAEELSPHRSSEAFLTSTLRGVQAVASIDNAAFADVPGPLTVAAARAYEALLREEGEAEGC